MYLSLRSPIAFNWGTLSSNHHGPDGTPITKGWKHVRIIRGYRFYRYFVLGDCVRWDFQLRREWWKVIQIIR